MYVYAKYGDMKVDKEYRVVMIDNDGLHYSKWIKKDEVKSAMNEQWKLGRSLVMVQETIDVTDEFYRS